MALQSADPPWITDVKQNFGGNGEWSLTATDTLHLAGKNVKFNYDFTVGMEYYLCPSPDLKTNGYYLHTTLGTQKEKVTINTNLSYNANDGSPENAVSEIFNPEIVTSIMILL